MKNPSQKRVKEHYQALRQLSPEALWAVEVPAFNAAPPHERLQNVSLLRAVGVVFSELGTPEQKADALQWLRPLLSDPEEKIRRYAMAALPKLGSGEREERELLGRFELAANERETRFMAQTLQRIGGSETIQTLQNKRNATPGLDRQRLLANAARSQSSGSIAMAKALPVFKGLRLVLECRAGLEAVLLGELSESKNLNGALRVERHGRGRVHLRMEAPFSLDDLYALRTFSSVVFPLGDLPPLSKAGAPLNPDAIAPVLASEHAHHILSHLSEGTARYRLEFASRRGDSQTAEAISQRVFARRPNLLNDSRQAPWEISISESPGGVSLELSPKLRPDPRFSYRRGDVPAASHPPLAAAMARVAGVGLFQRECIWDPFCGSGLELAECILRGPVAHAFGTDLSEEATQIAAQNLAAASELSQFKPNISLETGDFRTAQEMRAGRKLSLIITNPPLGKRVPVENLRALLGGVFAEAERLLQPGGRLVLINPAGDSFRVPLLKLALRQKVDLGFGHFPLERWERR